MARTRSPEYDNIQASILDKTSVLFATRGYAASSIGDIAEACGCSKSRLYHYFESKEAILSAMLSGHIEKLLEGGRAALEQRVEPIERFRELVRFFMEIYAYSRSKHVVLLTCIGFLPEAQRKDVIKKQRELISFVRRILKEVRPEQSSDSTTHADTMLFFGMINWTYTWYRADGPISPRQLADRSVEIFLDGYLRAGSTPKKALSAPGIAKRRADRRKAP